MNEEVEQLVKEQERCNQEVSSVLVLDNPLGVSSLPFPVLPVRRQVTSTPVPSYLAHLVPDRIGVELMPL